MRNLIVILLFFSVTNAVSMSYEIHYEPLKGSIDKVILPDQLTDQEKENLKNIRLIQSKNTNGTMTFIVSFNHVKDLQLESTAAQSVWIKKNKRFGTYETTGNQLLFSAVKEKYMASLNKLNIQPNK